MEVNLILRPDCMLDSWPDCPFGSSIFPLPLQNTNSSLPLSLQRAGILCKTSCDGARAQACSIISDDREVITGDQRL